MPKVALIQVVYNSRRFIPQVFAAALNQTYKDSQMVAVIAGNADGGKELILEKFPEVKVIDPGFNIGFARGHNEFFEKSDCEFFQLVNPDLILEPTYVEKILQAFADPRVAAATGKLLRYDFNSHRASGIIDTTGVEYFRLGRARDRGQHEVDRGQYDLKTQIIGVSGAGACLRKSALLAVKYQRPDGRTEYFDEDFHSYWEDVDLSLRFINAGFKCVYAPQAVGYHGRAAGSSPGGYKKVFRFISFHQKINPRIRRLNFKNHIFLFIKNSPKWYVQFFLRELAMLAYILIFEISTLRLLPEFFRQLPAIWQKRKAIQANRKITIADFEKLLSASP